MNFINWFNQETELDWVNKWAEDYSKIITNTQIVTPDIQKEIIVNRVNFVLNICDFEFPIGLSEKIKDGEYNIQEKWIYPFWKSKTRFYYPWDNNPLWKYLIILSDKNWNKISQWIHKWVNWEYEKRKFTQWPIDNNWCIRLAPHQIEEIFNKIKVWNKLIIK